MLHNGRFTEEVLSTYNVASVRIHIERLFARLKTFNVLNKITSDLLVYIDNILFMCCVSKFKQSNNKTIIQIYVKSIYYFFN